MIGAGQVLLSIQYRLSRVHSAGVQVQTYNRVIAFTEYPNRMSSYFVEGFDAFEFWLESYRATWSFRKNTASPAMDYDFDRFKVIGNEMYLPTLRARLSITPASFDLKVNDEQDVFGGKFIYTDASNGIDVDSYNGTDGGNNTDVNFYGRDVRSINRQRNVLGERARINATPAPEPFTEPYMETLQ